MLSFASQKVKPMYNRNMANSKQLKNEFVRITTTDGLELHGLLFEPKRKTAKVLIHIHGWIGNFYENRFIDYIAREAVSKGFSFLTFNNRGAGIVTDFVKRRKSKVGYKRIGGAQEKFKDCIFDIKAAVDFLSKKGYKKIILQGHSSGCQKAAFYEQKTEDKRIKSLILLAPVDDAAYTKTLLKSKHEKSLSIAREMVKSGKGDKSVPEWMAFYPLLNAKMFLNVADSKSYSGRLFDYSGKLKEIEKINCPILAIFGTKDEYQFEPDKKLQILKERMSNCDIKLIQGAEHGFINFESELSKLIGNWIKKL
jgi:dienelactone hydrolase